MPLPFLMQAAKFIGDRAQEAKETFSSSEKFGQAIGGTATQAAQFLDERRKEAGQFVDDRRKEVEHTFSSPENFIHNVGETAGHVGSAVGAGTNHVVTGIGALAGGAKRIVEEAKNQHEGAKREFESDLQSLNREFVRLEGRYRLYSESSISRFKELWERQSKRMNLKAQDFAVALNLRPDQVSELQEIGISGFDVLKMGIGAVASGVGVGTSAVAGAMSVATASTGIAVSALGGAAQTSAMLAWFGGGAKIIGGGGMFMGQIVLSSLFIAPAAITAVVFAASKGQEVLTQATSFKAEVNVAIAGIELKRAAMRGVGMRLEEILAVSEKLNSTLLEQVKLCESLERAKAGELDRLEIFRAVELCTTLRKVMSVPVMDEHLEATLESKAAIAEAEGQVAQA